jgi:hypothetical protein
VQYNSSDGRFVFDIADGSVIHFVESPTGLFFSDTAMRQEHDGCVLVPTVADNKSSYTNEDYRKAVVVRDLLLKNFGQPSVQEFIRIVQNKLLTNCFVTIADIQAAEHIFGPDGWQPTRKDNADVVHTWLISGIPLYPLTSWPNIDM